MSNDRQRSRWSEARGRLIALGITALGIYVMWPALLDVFSAWPQLERVDPIWGAAMILVESLSFLSLWWLTALALGSRDLKAIAASQLAGNSVSRVIPGGQAAGGAVQFGMLVGSGIDRMRAATGLVAVTIMTTGALASLPLFSIPVLLGGAPVRAGLTQAATIGLATFVLVAIGGVAVTRSERPLRFVGDIAQRIRNRVRPHAHHLTDLPGRLIDERDLVVKILGERWWWAVALAVGKWAMDYLVLMFGLVALGTKPKPTLVLLAYIAANVLALIPITPGGLGFVEAGLTSTLALAGVPAAEAVVATLAYRLVTFWLPIPIGLVAYVADNRRRGKPRGSAPAGLD